MRLELIDLRLRVYSELYLPLKVKEIAQEFLDENVEWLYPFDTWLLFNGLDALVDADASGYYTFDNFKFGLIEMPAAYRQSIRNGLKPINYVPIGPPVISTKEDIVNFYNWEK